MIDTVGMTTSRNLCRPEEARAFFAPIIDLAGRTGVPFVELTHLSPRTKKPWEGESWKRQESSSR